MESDRKIGKIVSVNSYNATIELDKEAQSFVKNSYEGTHKIGIINSYVIIPIGADKIVGIVTKVNMFEDSELNYKSSSTIILPKSKRTMSITMLGSIVMKYKESGKVKEPKFEYGVVGYPSLDNPVWSITEDELGIIFRTKTSSDKKYIVIGKSTVFPDYDVVLDMDNFFGKHAAILGNTGSGKSCTVTAIIRSVLEDKPEMKNAHFVIFDTNNEYESAFTLYDENNRTKIKDTLFERLVIGNESDSPTGFYLPHWFMNNSDYNAIFRPGEGAQGPILYRSINIAKENIKTENRISHFDSDLMSGINLIKGAVSNPASGNQAYFNKKNINDQVSALKKLVQNNETLLNESTLKDFLILLNEKFCELEKLYDKEGNIDAVYISKVRDILVNIDSIVAGNIHKIKNTPRHTIGIDTPTYFSFKELIESTLPECINRYAEDNSDNRIRNFVGTLQLRLEQYYNDNRYEFIFKNIDFRKSLASFLRYIVGENPSKNIDSTPPPWKEYYIKKKEEINRNDIDINRHRVSIIDFSNIANDVLENVTALVGRLIFEFMQKIKPRGSYPLVLILEEAHHYIPEFAQTERQIRARQVFEKIAKEGRKFGLSLLIASQRPSELSKTIMAQCNSFIVHRIQNPDDQQYFRSVISSASHDLLNQLPSLPQRSALVMGDCVTAPVQVTIREVDPIPDSRDPKFSEIWSDPVFNPPDFEEICKKWENGE